jgi:hypothetical protein
MDLSRYNYKVEMGYMQPNNEKNPNPNYKVKMGYMQPNNKKNKNSNFNYREK